MKKVAVIMGSDSDLPVVEKGIAVLQELEIPFEVHVYSAHRTPIEAAEFTRNARENDFGVIIAAAGMAAHLAGAIAANTTLPVIGIPTGIPVATVAVNGAGNAALLAAEILAVSDNDLAEKLRMKRESAAKRVLEKDAAINEKYKL